MCGFSSEIVSPSVQSYHQEIVKSVCGYGGHGFGSTVLGSLSVDFGFRTLGFRQQQASFHSYGLRVGIYKPSCSDLRLLNLKY